jgi:uncharacterized Zn-finger protein
MEAYDEKENSKRTKKELLCRVCGKACPSKSKLIAHERIHSGEKPYACDICKKGFAENSSLTKHKRTHTGEKPYECVICKNTFISSSNLTVHKRLHTGENHFSCDVCQKSYAQSSGLYKHNKTAAHIKRMKSKNINIPITQTSFVDCGGTIKVLDYLNIIKLLLI